MIGYHRALFFVCEYISKFASRKWAHNNVTFQRNLAPQKLLLRYCSRHEHIGAGLEELDEESGKTGKINATKIK